MGRSRLALALVSLAAAVGCFDNSTPVASGTSTGTSGDSTSVNATDVATTADASFTDGSATVSTSPDSSDGGSTGVEPAGCGDGVANPGLLCMQPMPTWLVETALTEPVDVRFARFDGDVGLDGVAFGRASDVAELFAWTWEGRGVPTAAFTAFPIPGPIGIVVGQGNDDPIDDVGIAGSTSFLALSWDQGFTVAADCPHGVTTDAFAVAPLTAQMARDLLLAGNAVNLDALWATDAAACAPAAVHQYEGELLSIAVGRFDGDNDVDIVMSHDTGLVFLLNDGNGAFASLALQPVDHPPERMWAVSFVGDDDTEDIVALTDAGLVVFDVALGSAAELPPHPAGGAVDLAIADFDGDGLPDVALADPFANLLVVRLQSPDFGGPQIELPLVAALAAVDAADADADGDNDLVALDENGNLLFFRNEL